MARDKYLYSESSLKGSCANFGDNRSAIKLGVAKSDWSAEFT